MSSDPQDQPSAIPAPPRPSRTRIVCNVILQGLLLILIFLIVNYLSCRHHTQWDLTHNRKFTLSTTTLNFLDSLEQDVDIIVSFLAGSQVYDDIKGLIDEYQRYGRSHINVELVDPGRDRSRATDIKNKFDLELSKNVVIIATGDRVKVVSEDDMVTREDGAFGRVLAFRGESALTSALIEAVEKEQKKLYLVTGHRKVTELQDLMRELHVLLSRQNAVIEELVLPQVDAIPNDCEALILIGPRIDLTPKEHDLVQSWWEDRKGSLLVLLNPAARTPNLYSFLRQFGAMPRDDRLVYAAKISGMELQKTYTVPAVFLPGSPVTRELVGINTVLLNESQSLRVLENDALLQAQNVSVVPLLLADERFWGETDYHEETAVRSETEDNLPPIYLAAAVEKGAVDDPNLRIASSRMVVAGNSHFLDSEPTRVAANVDFIMSALNWMLDREELIGITPKQPTEYNLNLSPAQFSRIQLIVLLIMPVGVFLFGIAVWITRRA